MSRRPNSARWLASTVLAAALAGCATPPPPDLAALREQVFAAERAFARTMVERDHASFGRHVA